MCVLINSDRPGACSVSDTVMKLVELLQTQCFQLEKVLRICLFIYCQASVNENIFLSVYMRYCD